MILIKQKMIHKIREIFLFCFISWPLSKCIWYDDDDDDDDNDNVEI